MALNIIDRTNYIGQTGVNSQNTKGTGNVVKGEYDSPVTISAKELGLNAGQTFSGQVVDIDGNNIKLLLDNNKTINAKLDGNLNAILGQTISFEVSSNEGGQTTLRPLYTNLNNSLSISSALQSAGLPETPSYVNMVSSMMDEGMAVNKNALWDMAKNVNTFPDARPETVVQMAKLSLPINELTINQFENYKSFEHQVKNDIVDVSKGLTDLMENVIREADPGVINEAALESAKQTPKIGNLLSNFLNAVSGAAAEGTAKEIHDNGGIAEADDVTKIMDNNDENAGVLSEKTLNQANVYDNTGLKIASQVMDLIDVSQMDTEAPVSGKVLNLVNDILDTVSAESEPLSDNEESAAVTSNEVTNEENLSESELGSQQNAHVSKMNFGEVIDFVKNMLNEVNSDSEKLGDNTKHALSQLLVNDEVKNGIKDALTKQVLLKPENFTGKDKVEEQYQKIVRQANAALDILNNAGKENPSLAKAAGNINDNVQFMNQLNQAVTYIQLPLLMNNKSAHGDLYVYTNKKSLREKDGNLSALLHLDMDNLGPMDVYVALNNGNNVKTHFYLQDEATIDFIADHIDILNKRLEKKGYNMETNITVKDAKANKTSMTEEFMKDSPDAVNHVAYKYSFDVRA